MKRIEKNSKKFKKTQNNSKNWNNSKKIKKLKIIKKSSKNWNN